MDAKVSALRAGQDLTRLWLCVDMDAFFAACEELDNPALVRRRLSGHLVEIKAEVVQACIRRTAPVSRLLSGHLVVTEGSAGLHTWYDCCDEKRHAHRRRASRWRWAALACAARRTMRRASSACARPCRASSPGGCAPVRPAHFERPAQATCPGDLLSEQAPYYGALTSSARFAELVFVKPCFKKYSRASTAARVVFAAFDPDYEACSLDEACLDITDYCAAHGVSGACRRDVAISRSLTLKAAEPPRHRRSDGKLIPKARPSRRWASGTGCPVMTRRRLWH